MLVCETLATNCEEYWQDICRIQSRILEGPMSRQILNGWKEISNHLERGVRTAQRWETQLGMPVHRPALKDRSAVVAFSDELDRWLSRTSPDAREVDAALNGNEENNESLLRVHDNISTLVWHTSELASQTRVLQEQLRRSLEIHRNRIASRTRARTATAPSRSMGSMVAFRARNTSGRHLLVP
jgi:hypothetical protein